MTVKPVTVKEESKIRECFALMRIGKFRHLIIVNDDGSPKRMVSIRDAFYFMCDSL
jgi:CBS domain-containing protein